MATALYRYLNGDSGDDEPTDDDMKLSDAAKIIRRNWSLLMLDQETVGAKIYNLVLTKEVTLSRLFIASNIEQQSSIFMTMMDKVIGFLDDESTMDAKLQELGALHVRRYNVKTRHFKHFRAAFLKAIKVYLPWSDRREAAWQLLWQRIITEMTRATQTNHLGRNDMIAMAHKVITSFDIAQTRDPKAFAVSFYRQLLEEQPEIGELFTAARQSTEDLEGQAARFLAMLAHAIKLLDNRETFTAKLDSLSAQHVGYGVEKEMLSKFGGVLIREVKRENERYFEEQRRERAAKDGKETPKGKEEVKEQKEKPREEEKEKGGHGHGDGIEDVAKWTKAHDEAWEWFWKLVVDVMGKGMDAHRMGGGEGNHIEEEDF